ncbi:MAG TPA: hypothetical protein VNN73_21600 [Blastocatellia bacterium]|nr:hypothetical protein [Blastocatellia bacterium]
MEKTLRPVWLGGLAEPTSLPNHLTARYDQTTRRLVIQTRQRLQRRKVGLVGPRAIRRELRRARRAKENRAREECY